MNAKIVAVIAIVVVVAAGCGAALFVMNNDDSDKPYRSSDMTGRLAVMGNANNDDYIDDKDLDVLDAIIDGTTTAAEHPLADANNDGTVDSKDREMVQKMIDKTKQTVYFVDANSKIAKADYPLSRVVVVGTNVMLSVQAIGGITEGRVVGVTGEKTKDYTLFSDVKDITKVSTSVASADYDTVSLIGNVDAILTMGSATYIKNEKQFTDAGIEVLRFPSSDGLRAVSTALTLGYLLQLEERAQKYAKFCDDVLEHVQDLAKKVKENEVKTALTVTMTLGVSGTISDYYPLPQYVGAKNVADWDTASKNYEEGDTWLRDEKYHVDKLIHYKQYSYDDANFKDTYKTLAENFDDIATYQDHNYVVVNSYAPAIVRLAYTASILYPEIYGADYGDEIHQQYIDGFVDNLREAGYKVSEHHAMITYDDVYGSA